MGHTEAKLQALSKSRLVLALLSLLAVLKASNPKLYIRIEKKLFSRRKGALKGSKRRKHSSRKHHSKRKHRFTKKEHRQAMHIAASLRKEGYSPSEAMKRGWATVVSRQ